MSYWILEELRCPSPLATALSSITFLLTLLMIVGVVSWLRPAKTNPQTRNGWSARARELIKGIDRAAIQIASWAAGTGWHQSWIRKLHVPATFLVLTISSTFARWPWNVLIIMLGMLVILGIFRHWSQDEDEALNNVEMDKRAIRLDGNLHFEVLVAVGFILVFAPLAFAHLQKAGVGFVIAPGAGPFTFLSHILIETVKAGSMLDYYDLFAADWGWEQYSGVHDPSIWAKAVVLGYRASLNAVVLVALKRILDIAHRKAEGLDLRHIEERLREPEEAAQSQGLDELEAFAARGKANARDLLERILVPRSGDAWSCRPAIRSRAATALCRYGEQWGGSGSLHAAIAGYRALLRDEWTRHSAPEHWSRTQSQLGYVLNRLGGLSGDANLIEQAIIAYRSSLEVKTRENDPEDWATTQNALGDVLETLANLSRDAAQAANAIAAYRLALEVRTRDRAPIPWAATQNNLGIALRLLAELSGTRPPLEEAITVYRAALEVRTREAAPERWAATQSNLGNALASLGAISNDRTSLEQAIIACRSALEVRTREDLPLNWATTQTYLGSALMKLAAQSGETCYLEDAMTAYRSALEVRTRDTMPKHWRESLMGLAAAQYAQGARKDNQPLIRDAMMHAQTLVDNDPENSAVASLFAEVKSYFDQKDRPIG